MEDKEILINGYWLKFMQQMQALGKESDNLTAKVIKEHLENMLETVDKIIELGGE